MISYKYFGIAGRERFYLRYGQGREEVVSGEKYVSVISTTLPSGLCRFWYFLRSSGRAQSNDGLFQLCLSYNFQKPLWWKLCVGQGICIHTERSGLMNLHVALRRLITNKSSLTISMGKIGRISPRYHYGWSMPVLESKVHQLACPAQDSEILDDNTRMAAVIAKPIRHISPFIHNHNSLSCLGRRGRRTRIEQSLQQLRVLVSLPYRKRCCHFRSDDGSAQPLIRQPQLFKDGATQTDSVSPKTFYKNKKLVLLGGRVVLRLLLL